LRSISTSFRSVLLLVISRYSMYLQLHSMLTSSPRGPLGLGAWLAGPVWPPPPLGFLCRGQGFLPLPIYVCVLCTLIINLLFFTNISAYNIHDREKA
jgi:hypothetical protein